MSFGNDFQRHCRRIRDGQVTTPYDLIDPLVLPHVYPSQPVTIPCCLLATLEEKNRLAASSHHPPAQTIPIDVRVQIHESMLSNLIAPIDSRDDFCTNWQFGDIAENFSSGALEVDAPEDDRGVLNPVYGWASCTNRI